MHEPHREQYEVGLDFEFGAGDGLHFLVDSDAFDGTDMAVPAENAPCHHREVARGAFGLTRGGAHLQRPVRPCQQLVFLFRRRRHDFELRHRNRALAERSADAVGASVAAADDDDMLAAGKDRFDLPDGFV